MWAVITSMYDVQALCGLFQPLCIMFRRYVGCYILYVCCTCVMWAVASYVYDVYALCWLLHVLTLTLTIIQVQCTARNPNRTTVAATRPKRRRVARVSRYGSVDREPRLRTKTKNRERRIRKDKDGERKSEKKVNPVSEKVFPVPRHFNPVSETAV